MADPTLQDISFDPNTVDNSIASAATQTPSDSWSGLDNLGSSTSNVAGNILSGFGNLVTAQLNKTALLTATGAVGRSTTNAPTSNPNIWKYFVVGGVLLVAGFAVFKAVKA